MGALPHEYVPALNTGSIKYFESQFVTTEMCNNVVKTNYKLLIYLPAERVAEMDPQIIMDALKINGNLIENVPNPTYEMCLVAVTNEPNAIYNIKDKPQEIIMMLASKDPKFYHLLEEIDEDEDKLLNMINEYPTFYPKIKNKSQKLSDFAVTKFPSMIQHVPQEYQTEDLCLKAVTAMPSTLRFIINQTPKICERSVQISGISLQYVKNKTKELDEIAVNNDPFAIEFAQEQTEDLCLKALYKDIRVLDCITIVSENIIKFVIEKKPELIKQAFEFCPEVVTEEICIIAVKQNGLLLKVIQIPYRTKSVCQFAVTNNPYALEFVPIEHKTNYIILLAIGKNGHTIQFVENQIDSFSLIAVRNQPNALRYIKNQTEEICMTALEKDILAFEYINNKTPELCFYAVNKEPRVMTCININDIELYKSCVLLNPKTLYHIKDIDIRNGCKELLEEFENIILTH